MWVLRRAKKSMTSPAGSGKLGRLKRLTCQHPVHSLGQKLQALGVSAGHFRDGPATEAGFIEGFHNCGPIAISFEQLDLRAFARAFVVALGAAVFLDVNIDNPFS